MPDRPHQVDYLAFVGLAALAVSLGSTFYFNAVALQALSPLGLGSGRIVIAAAVMLPVSLALRQGLSREPRIWLWAALLGVVFMALPFYLLAWAQAKVPSNIAAAFFAAVPLMILALSRIFLGVAISGRKWGGFLVGSVGLVILAGPGTSSQVGSQIGYLPQLALLAACLLLASVTIVIRKMPARPPLQIMTAAFLAAAVVMTPLFVSSLPATMPPFSALAGLLAVGVVSTAAGQFLRFWLIRRRGPVFITPNAYLAAMVGGILGVTLLGETLTVPTLIAFAVIVAGLLIARDGSGTMPSS